MQYKNGRRVGNKRKCIKESHNLLLQLAHVQEGSSAIWGVTVQETEVQKLLERAVLVECIHFYME